MLDFLECSLSSFRACFSRERTFRTFVILVLSLILREDHLGVTSAIRALALDPGLYHCILHFFRSKAYTTESLRGCWCRLVSSSPLLLKVDGRIVLAGDGVKQSKEGYHMPGVKKLHQESEDSSKGEYIFGHLFGAVGVMIGNAVRSHCLPLSMTIQDGLQEAAGWEGSGISGESHVVQMIMNGYKAARILGRSILVLDRYFLTVPALRKLSELNGRDGSRVMEIVSKAKKSCVAFEKPVAEGSRKRGRPRKKGAPVKLSALFGEADKFKEVAVSMYGDQRTVRYRSIDLLWGNGLYQELRFVLVIYNGMQSILASTDITLSPETIIELYAHRFKIESSFREFKQQIGGFGYHFWTKALEKLNHFKKKNERDQLAKVTDEKGRRRILAAIDATERFVQLSCIAMGLVQMMALQCEDSGKIQALRYLRTKTNGKISEATMMHYLRKRFFVSLALRPHSFITQYITASQCREECDSEAA